MSYLSPSHPSFNEHEWEMLWGPHPMETSPLSIPPPMIETEMTLISAPLWLQGLRTLNPSGEDMTKRLVALVVVLKRFFSMPPIHQTRRVVRRGNGHTTHLFSTLETSTMMLILQYMNPSGLTISNMGMVSHAFKALMPLVSD